MNALFRLAPVQLTNTKIKSIQRIDRLCFGKTAPPLLRGEILKGEWWFIYHKSEPAPVAYLGMIPSIYGPNIGYLTRVGVLENFRGHGLQLRLCRAMARKAKALGWDSIVTDTTNTPASANSLITAGYKIFAPEFPWAFDETIYWRKDL